MDRPRGVDSRCEYNVVFPVSSGGTRALVLPGSGTLSVPVSGAAKAASASYVSGRITMFEPDVTINVPSGNLVGTEFGVTFTAVADSGTTLEGSEDGCTETADAIWQVDDSGSAVLSGGPVMLVDRPTRVEGRCRYTVTFEDPADTSAEDLVLSSAFPAFIEAVAKSVTATYVNSVSTFSPLFPSRCLTLLMTAATTFLLERRSWSGSLR